MDNPKNYHITSDFASSGNDNSVIVTVNVPNHSIGVMNDSVYTATVPAPSNFDGRQIRSQITSSFGGSKNVPSPYCVIIVPVTGSFGSGQIYGFAEVTRNSPTTLLLRVRCSNVGFPPSTVNVSAFSVTARIRTVVAN